MKELSILAKESSQSNHSIWFGHFTTSTILSPSPGIRSIMRWGRFPKTKLVVFNSFLLYYLSCFPEEMFLLVWHHKLSLFIIPFIFYWLVRLQLICVGISIHSVDWCLFCTLVTSRALWNLRWETGSKTEGKGTTPQNKTYTC